MRVVTNRDDEQLQFHAGLFIRNSVRGCSIGATSVIDMIFSIVPHYDANPMMIRGWFPARTRDDAFIGPPAHLVLNHCFILLPSYTHRAAAAGQPEGGFVGGGAGAVDKAGDSSQRNSIQSWGATGDADKDLEIQVWGRGMGGFIRIWVRLSSIE